MGTQTNNKMLFIIILKIQYFVVNLKKHVQDLYTKNCTTLLKEIKF